MFTKEEFDKVSEFLEDYVLLIFLAGFFSGLLLLSFGLGYDLKVLVCIGVPLILISIIYGILNSTP